jgi:hypothetical protein
MSLDLTPIGRLTPALLRSSPIGKRKIGARFASVRRQLRAAYGRPPRYALSASGIAVMSFLLTLIAQSTVANAQANQLSRKERCASADFHRMDYLLGDWDVVDTATGKHFLFNSVEPINDSCAVRESLVMQKDTPGISITFFSPQDQRWYSYYHAPGVHAVLEGSTTAEGVSELYTTMILPGSKKPERIKQVTARDSVGRPHQIGYVEKSGGWEKIWDLTFCSRTAGIRPTAPCGNNAR